jgi:hemerythrin-like metal-binding protein
MNLKKIIWKNELSIGNVNIDNDHEKLLEVYNDLVDLIELNGNREEFARILSLMTDYVLKHFKKEEAYMQELSYPKLTEHKQNHRDYSYKIAMYNVDLMGINPPEPREIIQSLEKWWVNHIMKSDLDYENYKKKNQSNAKYSTF